MEPPSEVRKHLNPKERQGGKGNHEYEKVFASFAVNVRRSSSLVAPRGHRQLAPKKPPRLKDERSTSWYHLASVGVSYPRPSKALTGLPGEAYSCHRLASTLDPAATRRPSATFAARSFQPRLLISTSVGVAYSSRSQPISQFTMAATNSTSNSNRWRAKSSTKLASKMTTRFLPGR